MASTARRRQSAWGHCGWAAAYPTNILHRTAEAAFFIEGVSDWNVMRCRSGQFWKVPEAVVSALVRGCGGQRRVGQPVKMGVSWLEANRNLTFTKVMET